MNAIDRTLAKKLHTLREARNLVHAAIPTPDRYTNNLESAKSSRDTVKELCKASILFKKNHGIALPAA